MAAPTKQGLDYFRYSLGLLKDRKLRKVKMKYGPAAPVVYLALLELIYADKGYYLVYDDDVIWNILEYLQGAYCPSAETVRGIVEDLAACELFSGDHFKSKILTSKRIQAEYYNATVERKAVDVDFSVWLLSESEMKAISGKSVILRNFINRPINGVNRTINGDNRPNNKQSRVEKSRVEKSRVEYRQPGKSADFPHKIIEEVEKKTGPLDKAAVVGIQEFFSRGMSWGMICWAAELAAGKEMPWPYMRTVLQNKLEQGILDVSALPTGGKPGKAEHRSYDIEEFERRGFVIPKLPGVNDNDSGN